jgi:predicted permease
VPIAIDFALDGRVVAFAAGLALLTGVLTGLAPALQSTRATLTTDLKMGTAGAGQRLRHGFIAAQMALCLVLLVSAALLLRAFNAATLVQPGFDIDPIDVVSLDLSLRGYSDARALEITERILDRLAVMPGVSRVAAAAMVPLSGGGLGLGAIRAVDGVPSGEGNLDWNVVTPEYFETIGLPIVRGRAFAASDRASAPYVAIVNQTMAARLWPGRDPLGQRIEMGDFRPGRERIDHVLTVVGVARDAKYRWLGDQARSFLYVPMAQHPWQTPELFLRRASGVGTGALTASVRGVLKDIDPNLPLLRSESMREVADVGLLPQRLAASVAGSLGGVALLLAAIGLYGVTAFTVARRTREIGVRMALGASEQGIRRLIVGHALRLTAIGGTIGLAAALALTRLLSGLLFGISPVDPLSFGGTVAALVAITVLASDVPARRAAKVNPVTALRTD